MTIYLLRTRGGYRSLPQFLVSKYGAGAAKLFMALVTFRLINEIWSNTKVISLYFGAEGGGAYWTAVVAIMLMTGGSTIDSTLTSIAKLAGRDWQNNALDAAPRNVLTGRIAMIVVAIPGNLPLLSIYLGDRIGPAITAETTISGTMVMRLAPIFLLSWLRQAGMASFHMAFWPGVAIGVARAVETFGHVQIFPEVVKPGAGPFALDLGVNVWGLAVYTAGFVAGALLVPRAAGVSALAQQSSVDTRAARPGAAVWHPGGMGGRRLAVVHGSPGSIDQFVFASAPDEVLGELIAGSGCDGVVGGHCGIPFTPGRGQRALAQIPGPSACRRMTGRPESGSV